RSREKHMQSVADDRGECSAETARHQQTRRPFNGHWRGRPGESPVQRTERCPPMIEPLIPLKWPTRCRNGICIDVNTTPNKIGQLWWWGFEVRAGKEQQRGRQRVMMGCRMRTTIVYLHWPDQSPASGLLA